MKIFTPVLSTSKRVCETKISGVRKNCESALTNQNAWEAEGVSVAHFTGPRLQKNLCLGLSASRDRALLSSWNPHLPRHPICTTHSPPAAEKWPLCVFLSQKNFPDLVRFQTLLLWKIQPSSSEFPPGIELYKRRGAPNLPSPANSSPSSVRQGWICTCTLLLQGAAAAPPLFLVPLTVSRMSEGEKNKKWEPRGLWFCRTVIHEWIEKRATQQACLWAPWLSVIAVC